ncbi:MAG: PAS domain-containing sensor histidine kinase [Anaerolineae bacterium]|nr:PAS domain-containing sensor histidine kinase [Anaerolineae bacterium]
MDWLAPSVIATLCGSVVLTLVYMFLDYQYRESYLRVWAFSWLFHAIRYLFMLGILRYGEMPLLLIGNHTSTLVSGILLLFGTYQFIEKDLAAGWWYGAVIGFSWIVVAATLKVPFLIFTLPIFTFLALIYIWVGVIFMREANATKIGHRVTGGTFILWGLHKANYPILRPVMWFAPWGYLMSAVFELVSAIGILLIYFEKVRYDLATSQQQLNAFANALPDLGFVMDERGTYVDILTAQENLLYARAEQLKGKTIHNLLPYDVAQAIQDAITRTLQTRETQIVEYPLQVPAGECWFEGRTALMHLTTLAAESDVAGLVLLLARDITERIEAEKALHDAAHRMAELHKQVQTYADELEERVNERTADLKRAYEELQRLNHAQDEFVSNVSHELRTPITSLKLRHYLLERHPNQLAEHLAVMERETQRLEHTIEGLLMLSRLEQDRVTLEFNPVDLNALAEVYVMDRTPIARENGLLLHLCCQAELPLVLADDGLLSQVINIILTNAINYTPSGESITVSTRTRELDNQLWVGLSISDTGRGITAEEQAHLYDRFFRGKAARESRAPGTGLGLAIAKKIVAEHAGELEVYSQGIPGEGATFTVWLKTNRAMATTSGEKLIRAAPVGGSSARQ